MTHQRECLGKPSSFKIPNTSHPKSNPWNYKEDSFLKPGVFFSTHPAQNKKGNILISTFNT
jgi:hypothetical protein